MSRQKPRRRQKEAEARKKQWEKTRKEYDWSNFDAYGDRITGKRPREAVNGRRLSDDLRRLFTLTGDPAFETARLALKAYHLDVGRHKATARRLAEEEFLLYNFWDPIE